MDRSIAARLPLLRSPRPALIRFPPVKPVAVVFVLLALALPGGGWLWFRSSAFAAVQAVRVLGVSGPESSVIAGALRTAALRMSTLDASTAELQSAVASFPLVREVKMSTSFPHSMTITVAERVPVAILSSGGARTVVAGDGVVLGEGLLSSPLPAIAGPSLLPRPGDRVQSARVSELLAVLDAAPRPLARQVAKFYAGPEGLTAKMKNGLLVYFGDDTRPHAKWLSLAAVLAAPSSAGAAYIDVRLPERPAAGSAVASTAAGGQSSSGEGSPLTESLDQAVNGGVALQPSASVSETEEAAPGEVGEPGTEAPTSETPAG